MTYPALAAIRPANRAVILAGLAVLSTLFALLPNRTASAETQAEQPPLPDYGVSELSALESLDELLPANLYDIEVVVFKRLDTAELLIAVAEDVTQAQGLLGSPTGLQKGAGDSIPNGLTIGAPAPVDSREPLLLTHHRFLPANLYALSPPMHDRSDLREPNLDPVPQCWPVMALAVPNTTLLSAANALPGDLDALRETSTDQDAHSTLELPPLLGTELTLESERNNAMVQTSAPQPLRPDSGTLLNDTFPNRGDPDTIANGPEPTVVATRAVPLGKSSVRLTPYLSLIRGLTVFAQRIEANQYRMRPGSDLTLTAQARKLEASGEFQILEHIGWHQPVPARNAPQPIYFDLGEELQGYLSVTLGRYLHTAATLWLDPGSPQISPLSAGREALPSAPRRPFAELKQSRRMRSGELHYFDHPLFGVLVRVDKVKHPDSLSNQFEAFKSAQSLRKEI